MYAFALRNTPVNHIRCCVVKILYPTLPRFQSKMAIVWDRSMANVDNDVTPSFRVTPSCILIVSLWLVVVLCPPINVLKLPTLTSVDLCE